MYGYIDDKSILLATLSTCKDVDLEQVPAMINLGSESVLGLKLKNKLIWFQETHASICVHLPHHEQVCCTGTEAQRQAC